MRPEGAICAEVQHIGMIPIACAYPAGHHGMHSWHFLMVTGSAALTLPEMINCYLAMVAIEQGGPVEEEKARPCRRGKDCVRGGGPFPLSDFPRHARAPGGRDTRCLACSAEYAKQWRERKRQGLPTRTVRTGRGPVQEGMRRCSCKEHAGDPVVPISEFVFNPKRKAYNAWCKACTRAYQLAHPEQMRAARKRWRQEHWLDEKLRKFNRAQRAQQGEAG